MSVGLSAADRGKFRYVRYCDYPGCQRLFFFSRREGEKASRKPASKLFTCLARLLVLPQAPRVDCERLSTSFPGSFISSPSGSTG